MQLCGLVYGDVAKKINLQNLKTDKLAHLADVYKCRKITDFIRDWKSKEPVRHNGENIPMIFLVCPDGSLVRSKPDGDPLNQHSPWPHASKSVRHPFDASYNDFESEAFKVDNDANAIPKRPKDLSAEFNPDGWGEDAHTDFLR